MENSSERRLSAACSSIARETAIIMSRARMSTDVDGSNCGTCGGNHCAADGKHAAHAKQPLKAARCCPIEQACVTSSFAHARVRPSDSRVGNFNHVWAFDMSTTRHEPVRCQANCQASDVRHHHAAAAAVVRPAGPKTTSSKTEARPNARHSCPLAVPRRWFARHLAAPVLVPVNL